jgi:hypothetical protein
MRNVEHGDRLAIDQRGDLRVRGSCATRQRERHGCRRDRAADRQHRGIDPSRPSGRKARFTAGHGCILVCAPRFFTFESEAESEMAGALLDRLVPG